MRSTARVLAVLVPIGVGIASPVVAQVFQASGFATISMAGLGNTTTVAGDSRIPILPRDVTFTAVGGQLHVRATGHRGVVRQLDIDVQSARAGARYDFGPGTGTTLRVRMDQGAEMSAETGRGFVSIGALDATHVTGTYEGTFQHGSVPVVIRGRFEASFPRPDAGTPPAH